MYKGREGRLSLDTGGRLRSGAQGAGLISREGNNRELHPVLYTKRGEGAGNDSEIDIERGREGAKSGADEPGAQGLA
jgi:hypothetical protein